MTFSLNQKFIDIYPPEAAQFCNKHDFRIVEIEQQDGRRRFQIKKNPVLTEEEIDGLDAQESARMAETQRIPDLEDATIELAEYIAELEERITALESERIATNG